MKRLLFLFLAMCAGAQAQTILLKNGNVIPASDVTHNGDLLMVPVKLPNGGKGQVGYNISDIAELNLPEPADLTAATNAVARGDFQAALTKIQPVVQDQKGLRDIPGNYWAQAALVEVEALAGLGRTADASALVNEIQSASKSPEILVAAKLQVALATKFTDPAAALSTYDGIISQATDPQTLSRAWIEEGNIRAAQHEFDEALMDYLTVAVFYPGKNPLMPKALWGAGQAYTHLKDAAHAAKTYQDIVSTYPDSPEANLAKEQLAKKANQP